MVSCHHLRRFGRFLSHSKQEAERARDALSLEILSTENIVRVSICYRYNKYALFRVTYTDGSPRLKAYSHRRY